MSVIMESNETAVYQKVGKFNVHSRGLKGHRRRIKVLFSRFTIVLTIAAEEAKDRLEWE